MDTKQMESQDMETKTTESQKIDISPKKKRLLKTKEIIKKIPEQKRHLEFISAILTIPVLITAIILNINNLRSKGTSTTTTPTPTISAKPTEISVTPTKRIPVTFIATTSTPQPTANPDQCTKGIGPIDISYPQEGQTVSDNPLCISINYTTGNYCAVVWAYKINGGPLSDYSNNSVCLYNVQSGNNTFTLQVKSLVSNDTDTVNRHFTYQSNTPTPSLSPTGSASSSAIH